VAVVLGGGLRGAAAAEPATAPAVTLRSIAQPLVEEVLERWVLWGKTAKTLGPSAGVRSEAGDGTPLLVST